MHIKQSEAVTIQASKNCTVHEYYYPSEDSSFAVSHINGRYPDQGKVYNANCEEIYYVISGSGAIHSEKGDFELSVGDVYYFQKKEVYWVEGNNLYLGLMNAPKWHPEQHIHLE